MNLKKKKGFTIVELVIVIAVIGILAAVLIPTFANLINKAHQSADIQAVRQMNLVLATHTDGSINTVTDAVKVLDQDNIDLDNYKPLQSNHYFYFYVQNGTPKIVYMDKDDNVVFPKDAEVTGVQLMSLSGIVPTDNHYNISDGNVTIDSGAKLAHLIETKKNTSESLTIKLSGKIDLRGAAVDFGSTKGNITILGENNAVLSGLRADDNTVSPISGEYAGHSYGFGLLGKVESGTVTIENVTLSGLNAGNSLMTHEKGANTIGLVAGYINEGATVELNNVTFKDCVVNGYQKVGGIVGQLHGTLNMNNVKFENVAVKGYVEVAKIAGACYGSLSVDDNCDFNGIKVTGLGETFGRSAFTIKEGKNLVLKGANNNTFHYFVGNESNPTGIYNVATEDWVWYKMASDNSEWTFDYRKNSVIYNGEECFLNGFSSSASVNIVNGVPQA